MYFVASASLVSGLVWRPRAVAGYWRIAVASVARDCPHNHHFRFICFAMGSGTSGHAGGSGRAFGRESRLRNRHQMDEMRTSGLKGTGRYCVVIVNKTPPDNQRRAAFLISRRYSLLAVERNRARRLFREVYRLLYDFLPPCWLLFIPRQRMKGAKLADIYAEVLLLCGRAGLVISGAVGGGADLSPSL
mgnify:FL=1|jgi:ribonuclease P protein component